MSNYQKLMEIKNLQYKIKKQEELIEYYETMASSVGGQDFTKERVDCSKSYEAPFVKWVIKKIEAEEHLKLLQTKLQESVDAVAVLIERIENVDYRKIISYRYLMKQEWWQISNALNLSLSSTYRYHKKALEEFEKIKSIVY